MARIPDHSGRYRSVGLDLGNWDQAWPLFKATPGLVVSAVPEALQHATIATESFEASDREVLFRIDRIGRVLVRDGREILVDPVADATPDEVAGFIFGSGMVALLWQCSYLVLHGAAAEIYGRAVLFVGPPGCGKSSLVAALMQRGHAVLTDDVCAVAIGQSGSPLVIPGTPFLRLWDDALASLGIQTGPLRRIETRHVDAGGREKFFFPGPPLGEAAPLAQIYHLVPGVGAPTVSPVAGALRMTTLTNATYHVEVADALGGRVQRFQQCAAVARTVGFARLTRPMDLAQLGEVARLVEADVMKESRP